MYESSCECLSVESLTLAGWWCVRLQLSNLESHDREMDLLIRCSSSSCDRNGAIAASFDVRATLVGDEAP